MIDDFQNKAQTDYRDVVEVCHQWQVPFFATGGTALGAVRDGDFIEWDDDIDLGVIKPVTYEEKWKISEAFRQKSFQACYEGTDSNGRLCLIRNVLTAIHFLASDGDAYVMYWPDGKLAFRIFKKYIKGFKEVTIRGSVIRVIDPPEPYLEVKYGKDWREPIRGKHSPAIMPY